MKMVPLCCITLFLCVAVLAHPHEITITVEDADLAMPLEGAIVHLWDGTAHECDSAGIVIIAAPDDRSVTVQITYPGYNTQSRVIAPAIDSASLFIGMRLSGFLESQELVIEATAPGTKTSTVGRSVAVTGEQISRTAEISPLEDVMTAIKLLPGVGYTGMFDAKPSIRGGDPDDLTAVFNGFYVENPYHWGGQVSIFDPRMVESARLSHGVFSARYGHAIAGLLEVTTKQPDPHTATLETGLSTSSLSAGVSLPFAGKGGIQVYGNIVWFQPVVNMAQGMTDRVDFVSIAPYLLDSTFSADYRLGTNIELSAAGFIGLDGMGTALNGRLMDFSNTQGFITAGVRWNPTPAMVAHARMGAGFFNNHYEGEFHVDRDFPYEGSIYEELPDMIFIPPDVKTFYGIRDGTTIFDNKTAAYQFRADLDWEVKPGMLAAFGAEEFLSQWGIADKGEMYYIDDHDLSVMVDYNPFDDIPPVPLGRLDNSYKMDERLSNTTLFTSAWALLEYAYPAWNLSGEAGLRLDHLSFIGDGFTLNSLPILSPRLNVDYTVFHDKEPFDALVLTAGTGLFTGLSHSEPQNDGGNINYLQKESGVHDFELSPPISWTSIVGAKLDFLEQYSASLEVYYKNIFKQSYSIDGMVTLDDGTSERINQYWFDGEGRVFGFDLMLQKTGGRWWNGWLSYSFVDAQYRRPSEPRSRRAAWYYPSYHRFHNINLVLNINPTPDMTVTTHLGYASGAPLSGGRGRGEGALILDMKFSHFWANPVGKTQGEFYLALENIWSLFMSDSLDEIVRKLEGDEPTYQLPIPIPSVGIKWRY